MQRKQSGIMHTKFLSEVASGGWNGKKAAVSHYALYSLPNHQTPEGHTHQDSASQNGNGTENVSFIHSSCP